MILKNACECNEVGVYNVITKDDVVIIETESLCKACEVAYMTGGFVIDVTSNTILIDI